MAWVRFPVVLLALVALLFLPHMASAQGPPQLPCRFHGAVQLDGAPVADETVITATVGNATYTVITPAVYGPSTYAITIVPPEGTSYDDGTQVTFKVGNYTAEQPGIWETGDNIELDLSASTPPPPTPSPTPSPAPLPTVSPTPTPPPIPAPTPTPVTSPTLAPSPTPTPIPLNPEETTNVWNTTIMALCICVLIVCAMFAAYLVWKYRIRRGKAAKKAEGEGVEVSMRWQDRLMLKMMSNRVVIKIFSNPIVIKVLMWETKVFVSIISVFKRKKAEGEKTEEEKAEGEKSEGEEVVMRWQDRLMLKMMSNRVVIKIFSNPIVIKVLMWETKVFVSIISVFKRKKVKEEKADEEKAEGEKSEGEEVVMKWQDRLMLKMMSNRVVIKIFSNPIVIKVLMWETKVFMSIISLFKRKKAEGEKTEEQ